MNELFAMGFLFFSMVLHASQDTCGPVPLGGTFGFDCQIVAVPPPHLEEVFVVTGAATQVSCGRKSRQGQTLKIEFRTDSPQKKSQPKIFQFEVLSESNLTM